MSREVLGSPGTEPDAGPQFSHARAVTIVTDLDAPDVPTPATQPAQPVRRGQAAARARGAELPADAAAAPEPAASDDSPIPVGPPSAPDARLRGPLAGWRRHAGLLAAFAVGAALAALITGSILEKRQAEERMAAVRLFAGVDMLNLPNGQEGRLGLRVLNMGQDPVTLEEAQFTGDGNWGMTLEQTAEVLPGRSATVPTHLRLDCNSAPPQGLDLRVRTEDGVLRTVPALIGEPFAGNSVDIVQYLCHTNPDGIEIWSTRARDDGTLSLQIRNPGDKDIDLKIRGPAGTQIVTDPPSPVHLPSRSGVNLTLTVDVQRCTAAAQRAAAGEDLRMEVNGQDVGGLPTDPSVLAGWMARAVALACR